MRDDADMAEIEDKAAQLRRRQLRAFMDAHALKARPWAIAAGLKSDGTIRNFLKGLTGSLTHSTVERLARAAKVPVSAIFPDAPLENADAPGSTGDASAALSAAAALNFIPNAHPSNIQVGGRDLPVRGHSKAGQEGFFLGQGETWGYAARPESLRGVAEAYAVRVHDESMSPRYEPGTVLLVDPFRQPKPGDNVIVQLTDGQAFVKVLQRRAAGLVVCLQFNPKKTIEYKQARVKALHLVVGVDYLER